MAKDMKIKSEEEAKKAKKLKVFLWTEVIYFLCAASFFFTNDREVYVSPLGILFLLGMVYYFLMTPRMLKKNKPDKDR